MAKKAKKKKPAGSPALLVSVPLPPTPGAPACPSGFEPLEADQTRKLEKPLKPQLNGAETAAHELQASTTYTKDFGTHVPDQTKLANQLIVAGLWAQEWEAAEAWAVYARTQKELAFDQALRSTLGMKKAVNLAVDDDSTVAHRYVNFVAFVNGREAAGKRAAETRADNKKPPKKPPTSP